MNRIGIFNNGFIELLGSFGDDLTVVNAARCSFNSQKSELDSSDEKLIKYLAKNSHFSPFRGVHFRFLCQLPEMIVRQIYKHAIGITYTECPINDSQWNEASFRYIDGTTMGYWIPDSLRIQSKSNKQGSLEDSEGILDQSLIEEMKAHNEASIALYKRLLDAKVCKEQARSILTTSFNTKFTWTLSLQALVNFLRLRLHKHAQKEIQEVAEILWKLSRPICPISIDALMNHETPTTQDPCSVDK